MDDSELDRIASNNPALTAPAAQRIATRRSRSNGLAGRALAPSESSQSTGSAPKLTKHDVREPACQLFS